ncbi:glutathione S-transferase N-terminal domain-containing protein [Xanthobacter pseudotagetidis]|uniref:glutathione S-transferase N-terminal domain-containing protein n=1 Tax=Xanthobacter pseudotagetidis TaxID=3119911 RepID=UPI003729ED5A
MLLRLSSTSPFARKARLAAAFLGIPLEEKMADTASSSDSLRIENPLGKIPTLIADDGESYYDSRVVLAYLDHVAGGGRIIPADPKARLAAMRLEALADGLMDAGVLVLYEGRFRPEDRHEPRWLEYQKDKMARAVDALEKLTPNGADVNNGTITLACALGFLDFRFGGEWRASHPRLVAFQEAFAAACPRFEDTKPHA